MAAAASSECEDDASELARLNAERRRRGGVQLVVPLLAAPALPLIRIGLRHNPPLRDKAFAAVVLAALAHAGSIMFSDSSV